MVIDRRFMASYINENIVRQHRYSEDDILGEEAYVLDGEEFCKGDEKFENNGGYQFRDFIDGDKPYLVHDFYLSDFETDNKIYNIIVVDDHTVIFVQYDSADKKCRNWLYIE